MKGFTLVELVSVLLLAGIMASLVTSRFVETAPFDERLAKDQILALARSAQQLSMSRSNVDLYFQDTGSELSLATRVSGAVQISRIFPKNEVAITAGMVGSGTSCSSISSTITLNFDSVGEIETVDDDGFPICLNGESSLCISPAGFAHEGACL